MAVPVTNPVGAISNPWLADRIAERYPTIGSGADQFSDIVRHLVELGIDGIEHGALITEDTIRLMEEKDVYLVPTFTPYVEIFSMDPDELSKSPEWFRKKLEYYRPQLLETRELLKNSKLRMGFGSDIVKIHQCYESGYEYRSWMRSGFDPFRILKAATSVNTQILEMPEVGVIAEGYLADIAAWRRDLLTDENALLDCAFVMKDGVIYPAVSAPEENN